MAVLVAAGQQLWYVNLISNWIIDIMPFSTEAERKTATYRQAVS